MKPSIHFILFGLLLVSSCLLPSANASRLPEPDSPQGALKQKCCVCALKVDPVPVCSIDALRVTEGGPSCSDSCRAVGRKVISRLDGDCADSFVPCVTLPVPDDLIKCCECATIDRSVKGQETYTDRCRLQTRRVMRYAGVRRVGRSCKTACADFGRESICKRVTPCAKIGPRDVGWPLELDALKKGEECPALGASTEEAAPPLCEEAKPISSDVFHIRESMFGMTDAFAVDRWVMSHLGMANRDPHVANALAEIVRKRVAQDYEKKSSMELTGIMKGGWGNEKSFASAAHATKSIQTFVHNLAAFADEILQVQSALLAGPLVISSQVNFLLTGVFTPLLVPIQIWKNLLEPWQRLSSATSKLSTFQTGIEYKVSCYLHWFDPHGWGESSWKGGQNLQLSSLAERACPAPLITSMRLLILEGSTAFANALMTAGELASCLGILGDSKTEQTPAEKEKLQFAKGECFRLMENSLIQMPDGLITQLMMRSTLWAAIVRALVREGSELYSRFTQLGALENFLTNDQQDALKDQVVEKLNAVVASSLDEGNDKETAEIQSTGVCTSITVLLSSYRDLFDAFSRTMRAYAQGVAYNKRRLPFFDPANLYGGLDALTNLHVCRDIFNQEGHMCSAEKKRGIPSVGEAQACSHARYSRLWIRKEN